MVVSMFARTTLFCALMVLWACSDDDRSSFDAPAPADVAVPPIPGADAGIIVPGEWFATDGSAMYGPPRSEPTVTLACRGDKIAVQRAGGSASGDKPVPGALRVAGMEANGAWSPLSGPVPSLVWEIAASRAIWTDFLNADQFSLAAENNDLLTVPMGEPARAVVRRCTGREEKRTASPGGEFTIVVPIGYVAVRAPLALPAGDMAIEGMKLIARTRAEQLGKKVCRYGESGVDQSCTAGMEPGFALGFVESPPEELLTTLPQGLAEPYEWRGRPGYVVASGAEGAGVTYRLVPFGNGTLIAGRRYEQDAGPTEADVDALMTSVSAPS